MQDSRLSPTSITDDIFEWYNEAKKLLPPQEIPALIVELCSGLETVDAAESLPAASASLLKKLVEDPEHGRLFLVKAQARLAEEKARGGGLPPRAALQLPTRSKRALTTTVTPDPLPQVMASPHYLQSKAVMKELVMDISHGGTISALHDQLKAIDKETTKLLQERAAVEAKLVALCEKRAGVSQQLLGAITASQV
eukprot:TRINITY_DN10229_c0_g1_i1.p1 TRINITY_DN10229_c0_g1~~TRINITY_DN10229_c0_g1_i1.p1  ORF type:complete len:196 (-),score=46.11 TRINITY_DN10229_c0_g1_i1:80-667(-)